MIRDCQGTSARDTEMQIHKLSAASKEETRNGSQRFRGFTRAKREAQKPANELVESHVTLYYMRFNSFAGFRGRENPRSTRRENPRSSRRENL